MSVRERTRHSQGRGTVPFAREHVIEVQRARIVNAMVDVVGERGLADTSVAHIVARSGVSRRTFYELFNDREDCFLAALDDAIGKARERTIAAYESEDRWREQIRAGLTALIGLIETEPPTGWLLIVESLAGGPGAFEVRSRVLAELAAIVDRGRKEPRARSTLPASTAEGIVGGVLAVLHSRLVTSRKEPLIETLGTLMSMIVLPYLGPAIAEKETTRPTPPPAPVQQTPPQSKDPLRGLPIRITYRTLRVLNVIGRYPEAHGQSLASNRQIGTLAGIEDQGQISKLLARLARVGLIENTGEGHTTGTPNAWKLTPTGEEIQRAL